MLAKEELLLLLFYPIELKVSEVVLVLELAQILILQFLEILKLQLLLLLTLYNIIEKDLIL